MKLRLRKNIVIASVVALVFGNVLVANASNSEPYGPMYVSKTGDYTSGGIMKEGTEAASNLVSEVQGGRSLTSWIVDSSGNRVTDKQTYNSAKAVYMSYNNAVAMKGRIVRLRISTAVTTFLDTRTWGNWNPDYITHL